MQEESSIFHSGFFRRPISDEQRWARQIAALSGLKHFFSRKCPNLSLRVTRRRPQMSHAPFESFRRGGGRCSLLKAHAAARASQPFQSDMNYMNLLSGRIFAHPSQKRELFVAAVGAMSLPPAQSCPAIGDQPFQRGRKNPDHRDCAPHSAGVDTNQA